MNVGAREGDQVRVHFQSTGFIDGTVKYTPQATGDSWVIVGDDGTIYNVMMFEVMEVTSRKET